MTTPVSPPPSSRPSPPRCVVVVPVKPPSVGKSRLGDLDDDHRRDLARAFALDTVQAASATPGVDALLVVTDDFRLAASMRDLGCAVMPDGSTEDLNATLIQAAAEVVRRWPDAAVVALCADLPGLRPIEFASVLAEAGPHLAAGRTVFVRDHAGTGTTMYAARPDAFAPDFGFSSAERHAAGGAIEIGVQATSVRADVDEVSDLERALAAGVGPHTAQAYDRS